jgi:FMN phosphatase YigB (HAD superfamily)
METKTIQLLICDLDGTLYDSDVILPEVSNLQAITLYDGTATILERLRCTKVLLTRGIKERQEKKIAILKLRPVFNEIIICDEDTQKREMIQDLIVRYNVAPRSVLVMGNRRDCEIRYGRELRCVTVLLFRGKYSSKPAKDSFEIPSYTIEDIRDLLETVPGLV